MSDQQSSIGIGAKFKGKITGAKALEINGDVDTIMGLPIKSIKKYLDNIK